jgi:hypothetical protein
MSSAFDGPSLSPQGSLPSLSSGSSSLAQSARLKQLNTARVILILVGLLTIGVNLFQYFAVERLVNAQIDKEVNDVRRQGMDVDQAKVEELRASAIGSVKLFAIGLVGVGLVFLVGAALIKLYPVPVTIISLVLYVGCAVIFGVMDPETIAQGILIKILIVVGLVKAVSAALAYQKEVNSTAMAGFTG